MLACLMVICMHAPMAPQMEGEVPAMIRVFMVYSSYWTIPCVCLFFAVSGALLLPSQIQPDESWRWLKKRLKKVVIPTIVWTLFYLTVNVLTTEESVADVVRQVCSIPFSRQGHGILWFMYTLIGLYLVTPVISPWIQNCGKRTLQIYLGLWAVTLCYPILTSFVEINETPYGILYYLSGFLGYYVLGYYLHTYGLKGKTIWWMILLACLMPLRILYKVFLDGRFDFGDEILSYLGIVCLLMLLCWWKMCKAVSPFVENHQTIVSAITLVSNLSFGIYLMHAFVMLDCIQKLTCMITNYYLQTVTTIGCTVTATIIVSYIISLLPFGDYVIGFKQKRK